MFEFKEMIPQAEFDAFVEQHPLNSVLQSYDWYQIKKNWDYLHTGVYQNNRLVGVSLILIKRIAKGFLAFGYIPRGPILDYTNKALVSFYMNALKQLAKQKHLLFIKMDPKVILRASDVKHFNETAYLDESMDIITFLQQLGLKHKGFSKDMAATIQPRFDAVTTLEVDFTQKFHKKITQGVRKALKRNVQIVKKSKEDLADFIRVLNKTTNRKNISLRDRAYFEQLMQIYPNNAELLYAEINLPKAIQEINDKIADLDTQMAGYRNAPKKIKELEEEKDTFLLMKQELSDKLMNSTQNLVLSGSLSVGYGDTYEMLYAGFDEEYNKYAPQYLLYVQAMESAYKKGYKQFNMGGVEGSLQDGLTIFKSRYNGIIKEYIGEFDLPTSILYAPFQLAWKLRKKMIK